MLEDDLRMRKALVLMEPIALGKLPLRLLLLASQAVEMLCLAPGRYLMASQVSRGMVSLRDRVNEHWERG